MAGVDHHRVAARQFRWRELTGRLLGIWFRIWLGTILGIWRFRRGALSAHALWAGLGIISLGIISLGTWLGIISLGIIWLGIIWLGIWLGIVGHMDGLEV